MMEQVLHIVQRYLGSIKRMFHQVDDPRNINLITYPLNCVCFTGLMMFICRLKARWNINTQFRNSATLFVSYASLFGVELCPHGDTVDYLFQKLHVIQVEQVNTDIIKKLLRQKLLYPFRFLDKYFTVAIDGTQLFTSTKPLFPGCPSRTLRNGEIQYYAYVVEAKLVFANGLCFSLASEFVENQDPDATKQDCEHEAAKRLLKKIKTTFPRLSFLLLLDGLFADGSFFDLCQGYGWKYFIALKDDDLPWVNEEFELLAPALPSQQLHVQQPGLKQDFRWVNDIDYTDSEDRKHLLNVFECKETECGKFTKFKFITNFKTHQNNVEKNLTQARLRAKIENEGFNVQKNHGFEVDHAYSKQLNAYKVFYLFLQIAYTLFQLVLKGNLLKQAFEQHIKSAVNLAKFILEALRNIVVDMNKANQALLPRQIRLNDSS